MALFEDTFCLNLNHLLPCIICHFLFFLVVHLTYFPVLLSVFKVTKVVMVSDPGEGTSDGRVKVHKQIGPESKIKQEIVIKDEPVNETVCVYEVSEQSTLIDENDTIKSESESDCEFNSGMGDGLVKMEIKCEKKLPKKKSDSSKDVRSDDGQGDGRVDENRSTHQPNINDSGKRPKRIVKKSKQMNSRNTNSKKVTKERVAKGQAKMHKCHLCKYETSLKATSTRHVRIHTGEKPYQCVVCWKSFTEKRNLEFHQKTHGSQLPFHCSKCQRGFAENIDKIEHENECQYRRYECHLCTYSSAQRFSYLKRHMKCRHIAEKPFNCRVCSKTFARKPQLSNHSRSHIQQLPFVCSKCDQRFEDENEKMVHEQCCKRRHYECFICRYKCPEKIQLKIHIICKHTGEKSFQCAICEKKLVTKSNLNRHLATHAKKRPVRCCKCLRSFADKLEKEEHEKLCRRRHNQCFLCKHTVRSSQNLKVHLQAHHTGEKLIQCDLCDARFVQRGGYKLHKYRKHIVKN